LKTPVKKLTVSPLCCVATAFGFVLLAPLSYGSSRISGTYVSRGPNFAEMLQVTQTENGQITGVLNSAELKPAGNVNSEQAVVKGVVDSGQITINIRSGLLPFLGETNLSGTATGSRIQLQFINSNGNVAIDTFIRDTPSDFAAYVNQLKLQGARVILNKKLEDGAHRFQQTVQAAEEWIANARLHAQRIPKAEDRYQQIQGKMQNLLSKESETPDLVPRLQIANLVEQGDLAGEQLDLEIDNLWDANIANLGKEVENNFAKWDGNCGTSVELQKRGASARVTNEWETACKQTLEERDKFVPIYKRIMAQRAELKAFQVTSLARRKALVKEANQMNYAH
jgi:hypothetical protein